MGKVIRPAAVVLLVFLGSSALLFADNQQKIVDLDSRVYPALEAVCLESGLTIPSTSRPFSQREVLDYLERIPYYLLSAGGRQAYDYVIRELREIPLYRENDLFGLNGTVELNLEGYLHYNQSHLPFEHGYEERQPFIHVPFEIWILNSGYATMAITLQNDPFVAEDPATVSNIIIGYNQIEGYFPFEGYLSLGSDHWSVQYGRDLLSWGNGRSGNLILSDWADFHDFLRFSLFWKFFKYTGAYLEFDNFSESDITSVDDVSETLVLHRFELRFFDRIGIALTESMMVGSKYFELRYLNPFTVFHSWFLNDQYSNINFSIEGDVNPYKWITLYGQFCMDQFQAGYEKDTYVTASDQPNAFGYLLGGVISYPLGKGYLSGFFEWVKTDPWFYLIEGQPDYIIDRRIVTNYLDAKVIRSKPLGFWMGPDSVLYSAGLGYSVHGLYSVDLGLEVRRKGEIDQTTPFETGPDAVLLKSPSGDNPETTTVVTLRGEYRPWRFLTLASGFYYIHVLNDNHSPGAVTRDFQWVPSISISIKR